MTSQGVWMVKNIQGAAALLGANRTRYRETSSGSKHWHSCCGPELGFWPQLPRGSWRCPLCAPGAELSPPPPPQQPAVPSSATSCSKAVVLNLCVRFHSGSPVYQIFIHQGSWEPLLYGEGRAHAWGRGSKTGSAFENRWLGSVCSVPTPFPLAQLTAQVCLLWWSLQKKKIPRETWAQDVQTTCIRYSCDSFEQELSSSVWL